MDVSFQFANGPRHHPVIDAVAALDKTREQRLVANRVDEARDAPAVTENPPHRRGGEGRQPASAGQRQPVLNVLPDLGVRQRVQMITHRDALPQLAELVAVQAVAQFRLSHQNNLQQLAVVGFDVGNQPHLFQQILRQILRLVHDQDRFPAGQSLFQQKISEAGHRFHPVSALHFQAEFGGDGLHQFVAAHHRVQNQSRGKTRVELFQQRAAERRLARADLAGELHEALALADAVEQVVERLAMLRAVKKEARVRRDVERRELQSVEL